MHSTETNADLELLAALMDGRLSGAERARAVKVLAESDDEVLEAFAPGREGRRPFAAKEVEGVLRRRRARLVAVRRRHAAPSQTRPLHLREPTGPPEQLAHPRIV